jgi:enoyl-CoA hydratase
MATAARGRENMNEDNESGAVRVEHNSTSHVTTIIIDRPLARNAVDGPTATKLADAFRLFEANDDAHVAVLFGANGVFCSGADCKLYHTSCEQLPSLVSAIDMLM